MTVIDLNTYFNAIASKRDCILARFSAPDTGDDSINREIASLKKLVEQVRLSHNYVRVHKAILEEIRLQLENNAQFIDDAHNWESMTLNERIDVMSGLASLQSDIQAKITGLYVLPPSRLGHTPDLPYLAVASSTLNDPSGRYDDILFKTSYLKDCSFEDAVHTIGHEQAHIFQAWLARAYISGRIRAGHPLYKDAEILTVMRENNAYVHANIKDAYEAQSIERDAEQAGHALRACARKAALSPRPVGLVEHLIATCVAKVANIYTGDTAKARALLYQI